MHNNNKLINRIFKNEIHKRRTRGVNRAGQFGPSMARARLEHDQRASTTGPK